MSVYHAGGIRCPNCGGPSEVIDTHTNKLGSRTRRRRRCRSAGCAERFSTHEQIDPAPDPKEIRQRVTKALVAVFSSAMDREFEP